MRLKIFLAAIVISFVLLLTGLFYMQILKGKYYKNLSEQNRIVIVPLTAPRGKIYDRNKKLLVDNRVSFDASLIYGDAKDVGKLASFLSDVLKTDEKDLVSKMLNAKSRPFAPITMVEDIGRKNAIILEQYRIDYPGLIVTTKPKRNYIYQNTASDIIGYLGKISEEELSRFKRYGYRMTDLVGRAGVERRYNTYLRGTQGGMQVETDSLGRQKNILYIKEPQIGKHLHLTIDIDLQKYCDNLMAKKRGCIIAMDPKSGEVFAFVSKPNFNPSVFIRPGPNEEVKKILGSRNEDYPLLNRGISCAYPPGSIFKIVVAAAALDTGKFPSDGTFTCSGYYNLSKKIFRCWKEKGHGVQHIDEAIKNSCNVFFYQLGLKAGVENISLYAKKFGFGRPTYIDLPGEISGLVPTSQWKRLAKKEAWYGGDTVNYSIGQGYLLVTPIQVVCMMSAFANGGYLVRPYIVEEIDNIKISNPKIEKIDVSGDTLNLIRAGLKKVVNDPLGTGMKAKLEDILIAGKTGTAQNPEGKAHGWFSGFAPFDNPKICVIVFIEFGGKGGLEASIIARKVIEKSRGLGIL